jgi:ketopantoate reductase
MQGPPGKRSEAVKMLDAIIANGWSYSRTAKEMCDCGKARHDDKCTDLVRKRIRELESFLDKQGIEYQRRSIPGKGRHS